MDVGTFCALLSPAGQEALQAATDLEPRESEFLRDFTILNRHYPPGLARDALETAILRREAADKFPLASRMYFTREALEQASAYAVSTYRAGRFHPFQRLVDLGCSIGGDTLTLAALAPTLGIDRDPLRLAMAQANAHALDLDDRASFIQGDLLTPLPLSPHPLSLDLAFFFDPSRRIGGKRLFSVKDYRPPLSIVRDWLPRFPALGVKISPGVDLTELVGYDVEIEFISLHGELKEAVLWFGPLRTTRRRATVLPGPHSLVAGSGDTALPVSEPLTYLYEPDPSVLRAGLVAVLGTELDATQLDPDIAYLTSEKVKPTPFARVWAVEDWFPFGLKRLRAYLRERNIGKITVKKRGSPLQPDALIHDLHLKGDNERVIFLTHLRGRPIVIISLNVQCY